MQNPTFAKYIHTMTISRPNIQGQGMNGYIETEVWFEVLNNQALLEVAKVLNSDFNHDEYMKIYNGLVR